MQTIVFTDSRQDQVGAALRALLPSLADCHNPLVATFESIGENPLPIETELVILVLPDNSEKGQTAIRRLREGFDGRLIAVGLASDPKLILRTLHSGADDYLDQAELEADLESALPRLLKKKEANGVTGELLGVLAASGGCGASTIAINVGAALAKDRRGCCLVDLSPGCGDLDALLDIKPQFTLADLCLNQARLDRAMFEKMLTRHSSGIHLLSAPPQLMDIHVLTAEGVTQALNLARKAYSHVVVDLEDCFHDEQVAALQQVTGLFLVCRLDFASLRNSRRIREHLDKLGVPARRIRLVLNQLGRPNELPLEEAEEALGQKVEHIIPYDPRTINAASNTGIPAVLKDPKSKVAQSLIQLAKVEFELRPVTHVSVTKVAVR